ncbi:Sucrase/ferredoxin-like-domain-containing protein [Syncephalastrum racemosum]|uniref:Sucrase/ferredoxin-like-domain-containing protein n=1 Tax=Syncephalastrum racemosum TaxID=13706 RepID=A0A1X2HEG9_SYNRA|nr:Sucrase/ferredoxin-like-domain-containing protein [Syncephalastrum racemosum]
MAGILRKFNSVVFGNEPQNEVGIDQIPPADCIVSDTCLSCPMPCDDHKQYPSYLQFDRDSPLLGSMKPYGRHIMISTGQSDWPEHIDDDTSSLAAALTEVLKEKKADKGELRNFITNTSALNCHSSSNDANDVIIMPDNILVSNVTPDRAHEFYDRFIGIPMPTWEDDEMKKKSNHPDLHQNGNQDGNGQRNGNGDGMQVYPVPYKTMILICSHRRRDKRCGITAPILAAEFDNILRDKDMTEDDAGILLVSHVGGHKFAGNVICYIHEGMTGIWYGRVNTCHCQAIIEETLQQGKVIKDLYRGAMTHSFGESQVNRLRW